MAAKNELYYERILNAPRELVWEAWSNIEHLQRWWGPRGFTMTTQHFEFKEGAEWKFVLHGSDGRDYKNEQKFIELKKPELIRMQHLNWPKHTTEARLTEEGRDKTKVTFRQTFENAEDYEKIKEIASKANPQNFDRMQERLDELRRTDDFSFERVFNAEPALVFEAWSQAEHLNNWWGPKGFTAECKTDFREGGRFHYCMIAPDGKRYYNSGFFHSIVPNKKIVSTMYFANDRGEYVGPEHYGMSGFPGEMWDVVTFEAHGQGQTKVTFHRNHPLATSKKFGEDQGWSQSLDKLEATLRS